jgi:hypothetical protein
MLSALIFKGGGDKVAAGTNKSLIEPSGGRKVFLDTASAVPKFGCDQI